MFFIILIAKTFLGTFSINRLPPDPLLSRSVLTYEMHRDIVQLVRVKYVALMLLYMSLVNGGPGGIDNFLYFPKQFLHTLML